MKLIPIVLAFCIFTACEEKEDEESSTMCYQVIGNTLYLNCYYDYLSSCSEDGKSDLGHYKSWDDCYSDMQNVLNNYQSTGQITPGPGAEDGGSGTDGCGSSGYQGPEFDIQVDSQCKAAYAYQCAGNQQGVDAACAIYKQWQQQDSSIPNCPYCN